MNEIKTNDRFDKLTNLDIAAHYRDIDLWLFPCSFLSAMAYCITRQNPNKELIDMLSALKAFEKHVLTFFKNPDVPEEFTFEGVKTIVSDVNFESIPEILELNNLEPDFICLGALSRNVFYMILREYITHS